jgi:membrane fusion protein, adhesin transport system
MSRTDLPFDLMDADTAHETNSDVSVLDRVKPAFAANLLLFTIAAFVGIAILWATFAELDQVTRGNGKVIPASNLQIVQNLEGGIVQEILAVQGQSVKKGDVLLRMDATQFNADFARGRQGYNALVAKITRLQAEVNGGALIFPGGLYKASPDIVAAESALYQARISELNAGITISGSRLNQARQAMSEAQVNAQTASEAKRMAKDEIAMIAPLVEKGIEPRIELLRVQGRASQADGAAAAAALAAKQASAAVTTAQGELNQIRGTYRSRAQEELAASKAELGATGQSLPALQDRVTRTDVLAPITGTVNRVLVATVGGVVKPGEPLVEIVPKDDALLIEAQISPADIGFLRPNQPALVKLTAFDFGTYGGLQGKVEYISPDAVKDERTGETFYTIRVRTTASVIQTKNGPEPITAGMVAEVDVLNGKRSVMDYILSPIKKVGGRALRE